MKVVALIVTYNRLSQLQRSLIATLEQGFYQVLVVNNASSDGTAQWLEQIRRDDERLHILHLPVNSGGAGGFSAGLAHLAEIAGWTHACLFDDDAWPDDKWLTALRDEPEADGYCSHVVDMQGNRCVMNLPFTRLPSTLWQTLHYWLKPEAFRPGDERTQVQTLSFVGACITRECLPELKNALVAELFLYYDDVSAGVALTRAGKTLLWSPALVFYHDADSTHALTPVKLFYATRNLLLLPSLPAGRLWSPTVTLVRVLEKLCQALSSTQRSAALVAWLHGINAGYKLKKIRYRK